MANVSPLLFLGVGQVALAVSQLARASHNLTGTTRSADRAAELKRAGIEPLVLRPGADGQIDEAADGANVLVSFPPDGATDRQMTALCRRSRRVVYVSSTSVFGGTRGPVDNSTPVDPSTPAARARIEAEDSWRSVGAVVLRAPALYGPGSGLHLRLRRGDYLIPGDGEGYVSRIHLFDLATIILAAFEKARPATTFVVGDNEPTTHRQAVEWLCRRMGLPLPPSAPLAEGVHFTLKSDRQVDASRVLSELGVTLRYPTFREGFEACLKESEMAPC